MNRRTVSRVLGVLVLLALVAPFLIYAVPGVVGAEYGFVVLTGSMSPAIEPGDVVIVDETDPDAIETGDVITFVRGNTETPVTHRVVDVRGSGAERQFETKGDANEDADIRAVPAENVLGEVRFTIPYIGYVIQAVNSRVGFLLLVAVPLGLLIATELWSLLASSRTGPAPSEEPAPADAAGTATATDAAGTATATDADRSATATGGSDVGDGATAEARATDDTSETTADPDRTDDVVLTENDLQLSTGVLVLVVPYCVYIAWELQTALSLAVAFATTLSAIAIGGAMVSLHRSRDHDDSGRSAPTPNADSAPNPASTPNSDSTPRSTGMAGTTNTPAASGAGAGTSVDEAGTPIDGTETSAGTSGWGRIEIPILGGADSDEPAAGEMADRETPAPTQLFDDDSKGVTTRDEETEGGQK
ncbi:signal peptidase I [Halopenitus sp. POP-27]|uniref:signal peptidase I n=1 Tax=Halopenitus sp. POP-27 TaxID=2994425 RepID=UPI0024697D9A|nr:signal peptidase I [Halopenitus sp. POP-27]